MKYIKAIDGLRCLAIILVIVSHWMPSVEHFLINNGIQIGYLGVNLFFVISGFLITGILIDSYDKAIAKKSSIKQLLTAFYMRRTLRIFPLYYSTLLIFFYFNIDSIRTNYMPYILYYANVYFYSNDIMQGSLTPRWSLAVEEQFYVVFPFILLFFNKKHWLKIFFIGIAAATVSRIGLYLIYPDKHYLQFLTTSNLDALLGGGLLAYFYIYHREQLTKNIKQLFIFSVIVVGIFLWIKTMPTEIIFLKSLKTNLIPISYSLLSVCLVGFAAIGGNLLSNFFENNVFVFVGRISYGLYIYHNLALLLFFAFKSDLSSFAPFIYHNEYTLSLAALVVLLVVSTLSFYLFENPVNHLKKYFKYTS